jgi:hypothetical protein
MSDGVVLMLLENKLLRRIFGLKQDGVTGYRKFITLYKTDFLLRVKSGDFSVLLYADYENVPTASRTALGPTQPPIQWVLGALSLGGKAAGP